ncbi:hypothetical protein YC2023_075893 [Brassica napus]
MDGNSWSLSAARSNNHLQLIILLGLSMIQPRKTVWGLDIDITCLLCGTANESGNHLFFDCQYSSEVWSRVCAKLNHHAPLHVHGMLFFSTSHWVSNTNNIIRVILGSRFTNQ